MSATISPCGKYRYWLSREGDPGKRRVAFVMLNPSTADADVDDATIRRCRTFARGAGFVVVNLYAYRATKPADMFAAEDPEGPDNMDHLIRVLDGDYKIIVAWGANARPEDADRFEDMCRAFAVWPYCLGVTQTKQPRHPLYLPSDTAIVPWRAV